MVTSKAAEYLKNAELCDEEAARVPTTYFAEQFRRLAQYWRELADHAETRGF
jgi:hypothetical protein